MRGVMHLQFTLIRHLKLVNQFWAFNFIVGFNGPAIFYIGLYAGPDLAGTHRHGCAGHPFFRYFTQVRQQDNQYSKQEHDPHN